MQTVLCLMEFNYEK